jgi:hypothetical protein
MIHVLSVAQLMGHNAIDHLIRQKHQKTIEAQVAVA